MSCLAVLLVVGVVSESIRRYRKTVMASTCGDEQKKEEDMTLENEKEQTSQDVATTAPEESSSNNTVNSNGQNTGVTDKQQSQDSMEQMGQSNKQPQRENTVQEQPTKEQTSQEEQSNNSTGNQTSEETIQKDKVQWIGTGPAGVNYTYDASIISKKLKKYDYKNNGEKIVFLTFDDGASTTVTPKVLEVLDQYNVKATFFVMGQNIKKGGEKAKELIKEEFEKGHAIGNHSYSHDYKVLYPKRSLNLKNFINDYAKTDNLLKEILGDNFSTRLIRCPGGYMSWDNMDELSSYMGKEDIVSVDWNALSRDAEGKKKNANELLENVKETSKGKEIVVLLMHDTYGKEETAKALPQVIEYFQQQGYQFKTLS